MFNSLIFFINFFFLTLVGFFAHSSREQQETPFVAVELADSAIPLFTLRILLAKPNAASITSSAVESAISPVSPQNKFT